MSQQLTEAPQQQQQAAPAKVVPAIAGTRSQATQIPATAFMAAPTQLSAQQLKALAAVSGGAVFLPSMTIPTIPNGAPSIADMAMLAPGLAVPAMSAVQQHQQQTPVDAPAMQVATGYRDYSRTSEDTSGNAKDHSFPMKLHKILSNPEHSDYITWLPHGRSWKVLKPKAFEENVIPKYFRHAKYASFMRQVNGWGYKRITQGPDQNSYYHELFLRGLPRLCQKMQRPAKSVNGMMGTNAHPDFYSMSLYAPLPDQAALPAPVPAVSASTTVNFSGSDTSLDHGVVMNSSSVTTSYPATSSDSDRNGISSDLDRNGSSGNDLGDVEGGDRNINSGGSSDGREEVNGSGSDRNSGYNEDLGSDPSGSDSEHIISGSDGFESSSLPGRKKSSKKRSFMDRVDSSVRGSVSSERSSVRDFLTSLLGTTIGGTPQDMTALQWPAGIVRSGSAAGLPMGVAAAFSGLGQANLALPFAAPLTPANLSAADQHSATTSTNQLQASLTGANLSAANVAQQPSSPLTASNLSYLSLQNQLIQSQATIAKLVAYQQQMGIPPMPTPGSQFPSAVSGTQPPTHQEQQQQQQQQQGGFD